MATNRSFLTLLAVTTFCWAQTPPEITKDGVLLENGGTRAAATPSDPPEGLQPLSPIFDDDFEFGNTFSWDETVPPPDVQNCNCYFSGDCTSGLRCTYGPGGPFVEDICNWRVPKPQGVPGAGCTEDVDNAGPICDGFCIPIRAGSVFGMEDPAMVVLGIQLWSAALLEPAAQGGGPVDPDLAAEALSLPFAESFAAITLGRYVADTLAVTIEFVYYNHFCHFENHPDEHGPVVDLSNDPCRLQAGLLIIDALTAEIEQPGSGATFIGQIPDHCPDWTEMFTSRCPTGPEGLDCIYQWVQGTAEWLSLPPQF